MRLQVALRLLPFSHAPGVRCLLPGSFLKFHIFPVKLFADSRLSLEFGLRGPVRDFTVLQDLEKGLIKVWGHYKEGFVRYRIQPAENLHSFFIHMEKCPPFNLISENFVRPMAPNETLLISEGRIIEHAAEPVPLHVEEKLSLGCNKAPDWDLVKRRGDLREIFPYWLRLGRLLPPADFVKDAGGTLDLLHLCNSLIEERDKLNIYQAFLNVFHAGFEGLLSPRLKDDHYQGLVSENLKEGLQIPPRILLTEGAASISKLFIQHSPQGIHILPLLPPEFHCGRLIHGSCGEWGEVSLEWTKKKIRRIIFKAEADGAIPFIFQKNVKSFRLRSSDKDKGSIIRAGEPISCKSGAICLLDNFL